MYPLMCEKMFEYNQIILFKKKILYCSHFANNSLFITIKSSLSLFATIKINSFLYFRLNSTIIFSFLDQKGTLKGKEQNQRKNVTLTIFYYCNFRFAFFDCTFW